MQPVGLLIHLLLLLLPLLVSGGPQLNCSDVAAGPPAPTRLGPGESLQLRLSIGGGGSRSCHSLLVSGTGGSRWHFYARLSGQLTSPLSVLSLRSRFGGSLVAMVTRSNQSSYRAFTVQSDSFYASLSSSALSSMSPAEEVLLEVEVVTKCPRNWSYSSGNCFGAASVENSAATFEDAVTGCRHVGANLALDFRSVSELKGAVGASGWPANQAVWVGAAVRQKSVYFLSGRELQVALVVDKSGRTNHGIAVDCSISLSDCSCLSVRNGNYALDNCRSKLRYLCSGCAFPDCLVRRIYGLDGLEDRLDTKDSDVVCSGFGCVVFCFGVFLGSAIVIILTTQCIEDVRAGRSPTHTICNTWRQLRSRLPGPLRANSSGPPDHPDLSLSRRSSIVIATVATGANELESIGGPPDYDSVVSNLDFSDISVAIATPATESNVDADVTAVDDGAPPSYNVDAAVLDILNCINPDAVSIETNQSESENNDAMHLVPNDDDGLPSYDAAVAVASDASLAPAGSGVVAELSGGGHGGESPPQPEPPPSYAEALTVFDGGDDASEV